MTHYSAPQFPADRAFVVQFTHPSSGAGPRSGRIEHVASGRARRFQGGAQMMAFVAEVFAGLESVPTAPSCTAPVNPAIESKRTKDAKMAKQMTVWFAAVLFSCLAVRARAADKTCLTGTDPAVANDRAQIAAVEDAIDAACPCVDGGAVSMRGDYLRCTKAKVQAAVAAGALRNQCASVLNQSYKKSTCGTPTARDAAPCLERTARGKLRCVVVPAAQCHDKPGRYSRTACTDYSRCVDAGDSNADYRVDGGDSGSCVPLPIETATASATPTRTAAASATLTATCTATFTVTYTATPSDTPTDEATATPTSTPTSTSSPMPTATPTIYGDLPPVPHIVVNPATDSRQDPILPPEALTIPDPFCFPQNPSGGGCRLLGVLDGGIDFVNIFDASGSTNPNNPNPEIPDEDTLTYHWEIYRPTTLQGGTYAPNGITGYFSKQLTIRPSSFPGLEDTIAGADTFWRAKLTVTSVYPPFPQTSVFFRFEYQSTELTLDISIDCYRPGREVDPSCYILAYNGLATTEPH
jgi:hypothetical protein